MTKLIALLAAGLFASGTAFAGAQGDCTSQASNDGKMACSVSTASLNLTPEQKTKMDAVMAEHSKVGCNKASEAKYTKEVKTILTKEQYAKFQAELKSSKAEKAQS